MKIPRGLQPLIDDGVIDEVVRPLKSGKEAAVYLVACGSTLRCAKVYKDANHRGFQKLAQYQEGRKARGSRDERAMGKRSRHGRKQQEEEWKNAEVDALYRLAAAGVRVPRPAGYFSGVLLMEMIADEHGSPAPRLNEVSLEAEQAREYHGFMVRQIVLMLCAGLIHGDLSEYNVLLDPAGPVVIDLPQAVDAASNNSAFAMLARDVNNMKSYFGEFAPELLSTEYAREIWWLYQRAELKPDSVLTGTYERTEDAADLDDVLNQIEEARREAERRRRGREEAEAMEG
ncbi:MAG: PA4780 family RIO1-like protein kinase [Panacagrimonas sp.]